MSNLELRREFKNELDLQNEALKRLSEKCDVVIGKIPVEIAALKEELQREKEKREENQVYFSDLVEKLMEEIVQLIAKNAVLEGRMKEIENLNSSLQRQMRAVSEVQGEQVPARNSNGSKTSSTDIIMPIRTVKAPTDAKQTELPEGIHNKARTGQESVMTEEVVQASCMPSASTSSNTPPPPLPTSTTPDSKEDKVHGKNPYRPLECLCGQEFKSTKARSRHIRYHSNKQKRGNAEEKVYGCKICEIGYKYPFQLRLHLQRKHNIGEIAPRDILSNSYKSSSDSSCLEGMPCLSPAIRVPSSSSSAEQSVQSYISSFIEIVGSTSASSCSTRKGNITNPTGKHHGKDPLRTLYCLCGWRYRTNVALFDHIRYFTGMNLLSCKTCAKKFVYASQLKLHLQQVHKSQFKLGVSYWKHVPGANGRRASRGNRMGKTPTTNEEIIQIKMEIPESAQTGQDLENGDSNQPDYFLPGGTEDRFCLCNQVSYGNMIACDSEKCTTEWFHYDCVGISSAPSSGKWYCPQCRQNIPGPSTSSNLG